MHVQCMDFSFGESNSKNEGLSSNVQWATSRYKGDITMIHLVMSSDVTGFFIGGGGTEGVGEIKISSLARPVRSFRNFSIQALETDGLR